MENDIKPKGNAIIPKTHELYNSYLGYVILKVYPEETGPDARTVLFCNKFNQSQCQTFLHILGGSEKLEPNLWPKFVREMNASIFETIGGVVDFNSGYVLLFNIEGRHKYCFTPRDVFSEEVYIRHEKQLIPNFYSELLFSATQRRL